MTTILRRIEPVSLAKVYAVVSGVLMLIFALPAGCAFALIGSTSSEMGGLGAGLGFMVALIYPVFGAIAGFIGGWLYGFVYNLVADRVGGVELEFDDLGEIDIL